MSDYRVIETEYNGIKSYHVEGTRGQYVHYPMFLGNETKEHAIERCKRLNNPPPPPTRRVVYP